MSQNIRSIQDIPNIDRERAIAFIKKLINQELETKQISEQTLGWRMGRLSQATINKLRLGKFNNIPNFDTLEAIALYFGKTLSEFIALLENECPKKPNAEVKSQLLVNLIHHVEDIKVLAEIADVATSMLKTRMIQQKKEN